MKIHSCSILSAEFMRASIHDAGDMDITILTNAKSRASNPTNGKEDEVSMVACSLSVSLLAHLNKIV